MIVFSIFYDLRTFLSGREGVVDQFKYVPNCPFSSTEESQNDCFFQGVWLKGFYDDDSDNPQSFDDECKAITFNINADIIDENISNSYWQESCNDNNLPVLNVSQKNRETIVSI